MDYLEIIKSGDYEKTRAIFEGNKPSFAIDPTESINEYKVADHDIFDEDKRPKKSVKKDTGTKDANGDPVTANTLVEVARVGMPFQELIVERRVGFMLSDPIYTEAIYADETEAEKKLVALIDRIQNDNKMDYKNKEVARRMMSELQCAEIWYFVENKQKGIIGKIKSMVGIKGKFTLKMKILSPDLGDALYPLFDSSGDMISFARYYKLKEADKEIEHFDVYTAEAEYKYINRETWVLDPEASPNPVPNIVQKIMVIYYQQALPEWTKVQSMIERLETIVSNHADMNDYFGSPILAVSGQVMGFSQKGEQGKILELSQEAKANYIALSSPPESIKMELENLEKYIYAMSQTPNITFSEMKDLGTVSGIALKLLFLDAHMAVKNKEEIFGMGVQRRLNLIKACIGAVIDTSLSSVAEAVQVKPVITPYLPTNESEIITDLTSAVTGGIMSKESAIEKNPYVDDSEVEIERMKTDATTELSGEKQTDDLTGFENKELTPEQIAAGLTAQPQN